MMNRETEDRQLIQLLSLSFDLAKRKVDGVLPLDLIKELRDEVVGTFMSSKNDPLHIAEMIVQRPDVLMSSWQDTPEQDQDKLIDLVRAAIAQSLAVTLDAQCQKLFLGQFASSTDPDQRIKSEARRIFQALSDLGRQYSKIAIAQAIYSLDEPLKALSHNPEAVYKAGSDICTYFKEIGRSHGDGWRLACDFHRETRKATTSDIQAMV